MKFSLTIILYFIFSSVVFAQEPGSQMMTDTIITFDPETGTEHMRVIKKIIKKDRQEVDQVAQDKKGYRIDTVITFDPNTYEERIKIVRVELKDEEIKLDGTEEITIDTIITFDPETQKEEIKIIKKIKRKSDGNSSVVKMENDAEIDTIVTFDPETKKQSVRIVKRKRLSDDKKAEVQSIPSIKFPEGSQQAIDNHLIIDYIGKSGMTNVLHTKSGIYYVIENEGIGGHPDPSQRVTAHYRGTLLNGKKFDSSYDRHQPLKFKLGQVIEGWQESIPLLRREGKGTFIIPSNLAYGARDMGTIPSNSVLVFDIELLYFE